MVYNGGSGARAAAKEGKAVNSMRDSFGENLIMLRRQAGLSQSALAERCHVTRQAVSNWERDKTLPDIEMLGVIASALGVSASKLLRERPAEKQGDGLKISPWFLVFNCAAALVHSVLGFCGKVSFMAVTIVPWLCAFMMLIVTLSFRAMFRSGSYEMLAGFDAKKDSLPATRKQMYWVHLLVGILSSLFQLIFVALYFLHPGDQMGAASLMMASYILGFAATAIVVNYNIKTR